MTTRRYDRERYAWAFGRHIKALREARGLSQEDVAEFGDLSSDTIRRLERGTFSPSLDTLFKVSRGLRLDFASLFTGFELAEVGRGPELAAYTRSLQPREVVMALRVLGVLVVLLREVLAAEDRESGAGNSGDYTDPTRG